MAQGTKSAKGEHFEVISGRFAIPGNFKPETIKE